MKTLILLLFSVMAMAQNAPQSTQTLVIIGDSLTEGLGVKTEEAFPHLIQLKVQADGKNWKILNQGISGSTSASAPSRARWVLKNTPEIAVLALGANDGLRGFTPTSTEKNLDQAIQLLKDAKVKVILAGMQMPPNYKGKNRDEFEKIYPKLAKKHQIKLIPFLLEKVAGVSDLNQRDGIHPNAKGHAIMADIVYRYIQPEL